MSGTVGNMVLCEQSPKFVFDGRIADDEEKPTALYQELIRTFTCEQQWVVDACTGTGTGLIAGLDCGRNVIAVDNKERTMNLLQLRLGKDLVEKDLAEEEEEEEADEQDAFTFREEEEEEQEGEGQEGESQ